MCEVKHFSIVIPMFPKNRDLVGHWEGAHLLLRHSSVDKL